MLLTTDGQADAHGDDLSILYGAGRWSPGLEKDGLSKFFLGRLKKAFVLFKM